MFLKKNIWSPYLVGAFIGLLLAGLFVLGQRFGTSTGIAKVGALIEWFAFPSHAQNTPHFKETFQNLIIFDWPLLFVIGIFLGSLAASKLSKTQQSVRDTIWQKNYGLSKIKRGMAAFTGGILLMFGAKLADGCTSGHAITGGSQLSITSFAFMIALFAVAIPTSMLLYRRKI
ncbi:MAG: YeeE/YedE family protein [Verrucomicrobia bacterium]|nr:YeeE/YedE family protein [Verrucomicrobiota bacterium]